jgi:hypothetical protein
MPALPKLGVRRCWFGTAAARAAIPSMHTATGAIVLDEASGATVRVRVAGRAVTVTPADARDDSYRLGLGAVHGRYLTKTPNARKVTIHADHSDQFDPTRAVAAGAESPLFVDDSASSRSPVDDAPPVVVELLDDAPPVDPSPSAAPCAVPHAATTVPLTHPDVGSTVRALHARLLCVGQTVPGLLSRVASAAFDCVGPADRTALGEAYLELLQDALSSHAAARRVYAEQCAYTLLT